MRIHATVLGIGVLAALAHAAAPAAAQTAQFRDASDELGVTVRHVDGPTTFIMAGGGAFFDFDRDGDEDLFVTEGEGNHHLFRNDGGVFTDVSLAAGVTGLSLETMGVVVGDYDQDGWADLYLTNNGPNELLRNEGDGTFSEVAADVGLDGLGWSSSAAWADFERDGDLDLYVGNYIQVLDFPYHIGWNNQLFINEGTATEPVFVDRAVELGVDGGTVFGPLRDPSLEDLVNRPPPIGDPTSGCTLSVSTLDFDDDGDADLLIGNDFGDWIQPDRLYRNDSVDGVLTFTNVSTETGFDDRPVYNMGINGADYDHDGDWDIYLSNLGDNVLLRNDGGTFTDVVYDAGPVDGENDDKSLLLTSWATSWGDFNNDGWEDLLVVNGYIPATTFIRNDFDSPNNLWINQGDGTFERLDPFEAGIHDVGTGRGLAVADVNGDGWLDFYVINNGSDFASDPEDRCRLFLNNGPEGWGVDEEEGRWSKLRLRGRESNLEGLGARLEAHIGDPGGERAGGQVIKRQVLGDPVYLSSSTREVHIGLGTAQRIQRLIVDWPSGLHQEIFGVPSSTRLPLFEAQVTVEAFEAELSGAGNLLVKTTVTNRAQRELRYRLDVDVQDPNSGFHRRGRNIDTLGAGQSKVVRVTVMLPAHVDAAQVTSQIGAGGAFDGRRMLWTH